MQSEGPFMIPAAPDRLVIERPVTEENLKAALAAEHQEFHVEPMLSFEIVIHGNDPEIVEIEGGANASVSQDQVPEIGIESHFIVMIFLK